MKNNLPKLENMTEEEIKAWNEKMFKFAGDNVNKDMINKINGTRGWIF